MNACEQLRNSIESGSKESWIERLSMFHILLAGLSKNRLYKYLVTSLMDLYVSHTRKLEPEITEYYRHTDQHRAIYEAIKAKNLKQARKALRDHVRFITKDILKDKRAFDRRTL